jgi:D-2-hydroxyacid dehydrogenase (NADP+)
MLTAPSQLEAIASLHAELPSASMTRRSVVALITDTAWERFGDAIFAIAPEVEPVRLNDDDVIASHDLERIEVAFFSGDCFPGGPSPKRAGAFMGASLRSPNLRWLHTASAGVDSPVFHRFLDNGVRLTNSSGASAATIAHTVALMMLALSRDLPAWTRAQAEHRWAPRRHDELTGSTIGVVGLGPIGHEVVRLGQAFGMRVIACRRSPDGSEGCETWSLDRLSELAGIVDWMVLALPLNDETNGIVSAEVLALMKPTARIVNVGRGELIDEAALVEALSGGRLAGAGLDVFAVEPLPDTSPLWDMPNVIITPHSAGFSLQSHDRAGERFVENLRRYLHGEALIGEILRTG